MGLMKRLRSSWRKLFDRVISFWAEVPGSVKSHLNIEELSRITIAALAAGGGFYGLSQAIMQNLGTIIPAPGDAALAALFMTTIIESFRRLGQGRALATNEKPSGVTAQGGQACERPAALDGEIPIRDRNRHRRREPPDKVDERRKRGGPGDSGSSLR